MRMWELWNIKEKKWVLRHGLNISEELSQVIVVYFTMIMTPFTFYTVIVNRKMIIRALDE